MRRVHLVPAISVGLAMFLSACTTVPESYKDAAAIECPSGSDCYDEPIPVGPGGALIVEGGEFFFEITEGAETVQEGDVEVTFDNVGGAEHNFTIDEAYGDVISVPPGNENTPPGETSTATLQLFAGTYTYYCSVPGHRAAGMVGTLTVAPAGSAPQPGPTGTGTEGDEEEDVTEEGAEPGEEGADPSAEPAPTSIDG